MAAPDRFNVVLLGDQHSGKSHLANAFFRWQNRGKNFSPAAMGKQSGVGTTELWRIPIMPGFDLFDTRGYPHMKNLERARAVFAGLKNGTNLEKDWNNPSCNNPGNAAHHAIIVVDATDLQLRTQTTRSSFFFWKLSDVDYSVNMESFKPIAALYATCREHFGYPPIVVVTLRPEVQLPVAEIIAKSGLAIHSSSVYVINNTVEREGTVNAGLADVLKNILDKMRFDSSTAALD